MNVREPVLEFIIEFFLHVSCLAVINYRSYVGGKGQECPMLASTKLWIIQHMRWIGENPNFWTIYYTCCRKRTDMSEVLVFRFGRSTWTAPSMQLNTRIIRYTPGKSKKVIWRKLTNRNSIVHFVKNTKTLSHPVHSQQKLKNTWKRENA